MALKSESQPNRFGGKDLSWVVNKNEEMLVDQLLRDSPDQVGGNPMNLKSAEGAGARVINSYMDGESYQEAQKPQIAKPLPREAMFIKPETPPGLEESHPHAGWGVGPAQGNANALAGLAYQQNTFGMKGGPRQEDGDNTSNTVPQKSLGTSFGLSAMGKSAPRRNSKSPL